MLTIIYLSNIQFAISIIKNISTTFYDANNKRRVMSNAMTWKEKWSYEYLIAVNESICE